MTSLFVDTLFRYALSILPWFMIGILIAFVIERRVKPSTIKRYFSAYDFGRMLTALTLGMISPLSIMSFLPIANQIVASGANPGMVFSFFIAERAYDLQSFFIISSLFGVRFAVINAFAILMSLFAAAMVIRREKVVFKPHDAEGQQSFLTRQIRLLVIVVFGIIVGALLRVLVPTDRFSQLTGGHVEGIVGGGVLGLLLYFGPIMGNYPVAKAFADLGMSQSGVFAFLTISPVVNIIVIMLFGAAVGYKNTYKAFIAYAAASILLTFLLTRLL